MTKWYLTFPLHLEKSTSSAVETAQQSKPCSRIWQSCPRTLWKKKVISAFEKEYIIENLLCNHFLKNSFSFICKFLCHSCISTVMHMFTVCIVNYGTCSEALIRIFLSCMYLLYIFICRGGFSSFVYMVSNWVLY